MKILAMCITWNRPLLLGRSIHAFLQQTNKDARLLVLDDAGQYDNQEHETWSLISTSKRYSCMGAKRNAVLDFALQRYPDMDGFMLWDDDDVYFSHTMDCVATALKEKCWAQPRMALELNEDGESLRRVYTSATVTNDFDRSLCYGGCWAWRMSAFNSIGRFPETDHGEDIKTAFPTLDLYGSSADSSPDEPWYYYNRLNNSICGDGRNFYADRGRQEIEYVRDIPIGWNGLDFSKLPIDPGVSRRPW